MSFFNYAPAHAPHGVRRPRCDESVNGCLPRCVRKLNLPPAKAQSSERFPLQLQLFAPRWAVSTGYNPCPSLGFQWYWGPEAKRRAINWFTNRPQRSVTTPFGGPGVGLPCTLELLLLVGSCSRHGRKEFERGRGSEGSRDSDWGTPQYQYTPLPRRLIIFANKQLADRVALVNSRKGQSSNFHSNAWESIRGNRVFVFLCHLATTYPSISPWAGGETRKPSTQVAFRACAISQSEYKFSDSSPAIPGTDSERDGGGAERSVQLPQSARLTNHPKFLPSRTKDINLRLGLGPFRPASVSNPVVLFICGTGGYMGTHQCDEFQTLVASAGELFALLFLRNPPPLSCQPG